MVGFKPEGFGQIFLHGGHVGGYLGFLHTQANVYVAHAIALFRYQFSRFLKKNQTVDAFIGRIRIGKMPADIAQGQRAQQGIANGMHQYIGIRMPVQALFKRHIDTA